MKRWLITGGDGKLSKEILKYNQGRYYITAPTRQQMNITDYKNVDDYLGRHRPDIILHAAAYTRPMKIHHENPDVSINTNIIGTANLVRACIKYQTKIVYISTDYVYPGTTGMYEEDDNLNPFTKYGRSKLGGECAVKIYDNSLILRLCMCNHPFPHSKAFVDVKKSLMYNHDAAKIILYLLEEYGTINVGGESQSVYDFAVLENPLLEKLSRADVNDVEIAPDTTMNISKLKGVLANL